MSIASALMHPLSRGSAHIESADLTVAPVIDQNYFARPEDSEVLFATKKFPLKLQKTAHFGEVVREQLAPTPDEIPSDEKMKDHTQNNRLAVWDGFFAAPVGWGCHGPDPDS
ncbi:FAD-linked reductase [Lentinus tigrinus ALCF2SS1-7]|uniref:FAD-linked reductase n=1 Tax=Lentinus tigrinus ALCF2SS1-7 TaxID=1328758 RepID=UPI001165DDE8|nr:FAD-linked reductase [Lentinus tigrinus ALCF2SS1-7]